MYLLSIGLSTSLLKLPRNVLVVFVVVRIKVGIDVWLYGLWLPHPIYFEQRQQQRARQAYH